MVSSYTLNYRFAKGELITIALESSEAYWVCLGFKGDPALR